MNETDLRTLSAAVEYLLGQESVSSTLERLRGDLARSTETFVWATVDLDAIPCEMPASIRSCWIFRLRRDVPSGAHHHPNSVQHMVMIRGQGTSIIAGERGRMVPFTSSETPLAEKWLIIPRNVPHEFVPERDDMTVVSFHTCGVGELEEIDSATGQSRFYEGPDA